VIPHTLIPGAPILLVGEAPDRASTEAGRPFAGESGRQLDHFLKIAKINKTECSLANVFNIPPPDNKLLNFCGPTWKGNPLPYLERGHYVQPPYLPHLDVLAESISLCSPNLIIGLGNTACWALLHKTGIGSLRGYVTKTFFGTKFLPTYHPGAVRNNPKLFPIVAEDFIKARRHSGPEQLSRPERTICVADTLREAQEFWNLHGGSRYSCDVETKNNEITCIGFAAKKTHALVVPFVDGGEPMKTNSQRGDLLNVSSPKVLLSSTMDLMILAIFYFVIRFLSKPRSKTQWLCTMLWNRNCKNRSAPSEASSQTNPPGNSCDSK
jgi:uracil-DNA glycosylase